MLNATGSLRHRRVDLNSCRTSRTRNVAIEDTAANKHIIVLFLADSYSEYT